MKKKIWILTLFPEYFSPLIQCGVAGSALRGERKEGLSFDLKLVNIRDFAVGNYKSVDDSPYGGGPGMIMRADILKDALFKGVIEAGGYGANFKENLCVIYTSPRGKLWSHQLAREFAIEKIAGVKDLVFICGRYEGIDERFLENYVDEYYSIGDFVLTGGELAVMVMIDSAIRFTPGVLGNKLSSLEDSFEDGLLECPQYTKPRDFEGKLPPEVLLNGHHARMLDWQKGQKEKMTKDLRPDLFEKWEKRK